MVASRNMSMWEIPRRAFTFHCFLKALQRMRYKSAASDFEETVQDLRDASTAMRYEDLKDKAILWSAAIAQGIQPSLRSHGYYLLYWLEVMRSGNSVWELLSLTPSACKSLVLPSPGDVIVPKELVCYVWRSIIRNSLWVQTAWCAQKFPEISIHASQSSTDPNASEIHWTNRQNQ